jgi:hypothetical protein
LRQLSRPWIAPNSQVNNGAAFYGSAELAGSRNIYLTLNQNMEQVISRLLVNWADLVI